MLAPWILFLFVGAFDLGFYLYSMIAVENAARVAASYTSKGPSLASAQAAACTLVLEELVALPNVNGTLTDCNTLPVIVSANAVTGPDGNPASSVSVTYQSRTLIPIPGYLMQRLTITRNATMRVKP